MSEPVKVNFIYHQQHSKSCIKTWWKLHFKKRMYVEKLLIAMNGTPSHESKYCSQKQLMELKMELNAWHKASVLGILYDYLMNGSVFETEHLNSFSKN